MSVEADMQYFDFPAFFVDADSPASGAKTQQLLDWHPAGPTLLEDLDGGAYG